MSDVLQYQETEGETIREALKRHHGIVCAIVRPARPVEPEPNSASSGEVTLYSYMRRSNGQRVWLVELVIFTPPDAQWTRSWVLATEPSDQRIATLLLTNEGSAT